MKSSTLQRRISNRLFCFGLVAVLAAGLTVAPLRVIAQQAAPAAASQASADAAAEKQHKSAEKEADEEAANQFRHNPLVKSAARMVYHDSGAAQELQDQHDETIATATEILNFAIVVFAIGIPVYKYLPKFLRNRAEKVRADIESARKVTEDANSRLSAVEAKLASLGDEIKKFRAEVEAESQQDEARIKAALAEESARIVASAEQEIGVAAAQATRGLRSFAAELAIDQAAKQLILTPETDRALIAEFVGAVSVHGEKPKGGLN
ncbi:MAG: ATP synthase F0 subunit B [Terracidiphilus sp.]